MMNRKKIENLIVKYLTNEANSADLDFLCMWMGNPKNEKVFESYVQTYFEVKLLMSEPDIEKIKKTLSQKIKKDKNPFFRYRLDRVLKYVAVLILFLGVYLYQKENTTNVSENSQLPVLVPKDEAITVQLEDGELYTIKSNGESTLKDAEGNVLGVQKKSQLRYGQNNNLSEAVYNILNVPNGKRFDVVLSDGTHVYLNSGTSLKYPVSFIKGEKRQVFLTGEAYFDVVEDKERPFLVHADDMIVKVLGTKFNVAHYSEEEHINTVLVSGSVELYDDQGNNNAAPTLLKPGFMAAWSKVNKDMSVENVDTRLHTAWMEGKLIFRNRTFKYIRSTLERYYNITIKCSNTELDQQRFDATFDIETIDEILETFNKSYAIDFSIQNNEVLIN
ncbi:MAG: FecR domain-containing protein [Flavobacteriaceae bacterium]